MDNSKIQKETKSMSYIDLKKIGDQIRIVEIPLPNGKVAEGYIYENVKYLSVKEIGRCYGFKGEQLKTFTKSAINNESSKTLVEKRIISYQNGKYIKANTVDYNNLNMFLEVYANEKIKRHEIQKQFLKYFKEYKSFDSDWIFIHNGTSKIMGKKLKRLFNKSTELQNIISDDEAISFNKFIEILCTYELNIKNLNQCKVLFTEFNRANQLLEKITSLILENPGYLIIEPEGNPVFKKNKEGY